MFFLQRLDLIVQPLNSCLVPIPHRCLLLISIFQQRILHLELRLQFGNLFTHILRLIPRLPHLLTLLGQLLLQLFQFLLILGHLALPFLPQRINPLSKIRPYHRHILLHCLHRLLQIGRIGIQCLHLLLRLGQLLLQPLGTLTVLIPFLHNFIILGSIFLLTTINLFIQIRDFGFILFSHGITIHLTILHLIFQLFHGTFGTIQSIGIILGFLSYLLIFFAQFISFRLYLL